MISYDFFIFLSIQFKSIHLFRPPCMTCSSPLWTQGMIRPCLLIFIRDSDRLPVHGELHGSPSSSSVTPLFPWYLFYCVTRAAWHSAIFMSDLFFNEVHPACRWGLSLLTKHAVTTLLVEGKWMVLLKGCFVL